MDESYLDESEKKEKEPGKRRKAPRSFQRNRFIDTEASVDGDATADVDEDN